jgi:hypothetical protein
LKCTLSKIEILKDQYVQRQTTTLASLLRCYDLQLAWNVCEEVGVRLGFKFALVGLLNKVLVSLLVGKVDGILLALELDPLAVHEVSG